MKRNRHNGQRGYALLTAMGVGVIVLSMTAAVVLRMSSSTRQITQRETLDQAQSLTESVLNNVLDGMAEVTASGTGSSSGIYLSATQLANNMQTTDFLNTNLNGLTQVAGSTPTAGSEPIIMSQVSGSGNLPSAAVAPYTHTYVAAGQAFTRTPGTPSGTFWASLDTLGTHSTTFWNAFRNDSPTNALTGASMVGFPLSQVLEDLHANAYSVYHVQKGKLQADVEVSIVPLATDVDATDDTTLHNENTFKSHNDVFRVRVISYIPDIRTARRVHRVEVTVNRPVKRKDARDYAFKQAILAGGAVNLQNFNTSSGPCAASSGATCIDHTTAGDVHSNTSISIGANGHVQGKVTAVGTVNVNGDVLPGTTYQNGSGSADPRNGSNVTNRVDNPHDSQSGVDPIPLPNFDMSTADVDSTACVNTGTATDIVYENCKLTGSISNHHGESVTFKGTVHITGDTDIHGSQRCGSLTACKVVIDGTAGIGGNGSSTMSSTADALYIVKGTGATAGSTCLDVGGTPDATGSFGSLFYIANPDCNSTVRGNSDFFGGIITQGTVNTVGNASTNGIQRDSDMTALAAFIQPETVPKNELFPAVIAWKNLR